MKELLNFNVKELFDFMLQGEGAAIKDVVEAGIIDLYLTKFWGMKYALNATNTILKVDQIIMAKRAGGPKPPSGGPKPPSGGAGDDDE